MSYIDGKAWREQVPPTSGLATRFLSRYDKSATNIKESEIFVKIGQVRRGSSVYS